MSDQTLISPSAATPLVDEDSGKLILSGRIRDVQSANSLYVGMVNLDRIASRNRSRVQSMIDGFPPKSNGSFGDGWNWGGGNTQGNVAQNNRQTCVNWGDGEVILHEETAPYIDMLFATETFGTLPIKDTKMEKSSKQDWEQIMAEEATRLLWSWDQFIPRRLLSINYFKTHGMSFDFFGDEINWQWDTANMADFKIPPKTKIGSKNIKYCAVRVPIDPEDLYAKVKNPMAEKAGWNVEETKLAIMEAAPDIPNRTDWEAWESFYKDNDYMMSEDGQVCVCIYMWVQELDGRISQYLFRESGQGDFLYKKIGRYADMSEFVHVYMDNIGTNGKYRSIRGVGHRIYSMVQTLNRKINSFSDLVDFAACPMLQPDADVDLDSSATEQVGPFTIINPGWKIPDRKAPDYETSMLPAINLFSAMLQKRSSNFGASSKYLNPGQKVNDRQAEIQMAESAQLSDTAVNLYYMVWEGQWQEFVRRITRKGYLPIEPGGKEVAEFRRRCVERGVPEEVIYNVDYRSARVTRALGSGSAQNRLIVLDRLEQEAPGFAPQYQELYRRDKVRAIAGQQAADRYTPKPEDQTVPIDASIAQNENNDLVQGLPVQVLMGQNNMVHAQMHLERVSMLNDEIVQGGEPALVQNIYPMSFLLNHTYQHLNAANPDDPNVKMLGDQARKFDQIVVNGFRHVQKLRDNAQREMEHNSGKIGDQQVGPDGQPQPSVDAQGQPVQGQPQMDVNGQPVPAQPHDDASSRLAQTEAIRQQALWNDLDYKAQKHALDLKITMDRAEQAAKLAQLKAITDIQRS